MKAEYLGKPVQNYYGLDLVTGQVYEIPETLEDKVRSNPNFKVKRGYKITSKKQGTKED